MGRVLSREGRMLYSIKFAMAPAFNPPLFSFGDSRIVAPIAMPSSVT